MSVAFVERLLRSCVDLRFTPYTWRRCLLAAMVVADKVYEDYAVWNADFVSMFPKSDIQVEQGKGLFFFFFEPIRCKDVNSLERAFLNAIEFATTVRQGLPGLFGRF